MFRKFLAGIIFSLFQVLFVPVSLSFGIYATFLNEDFYKGDFVKLVYDFSIDELPRNVNLVDFPLSEEQLKEILKTVFVKEDVLFMVESLFDQFNELEMSKNGSFSLIIDLEWLQKKSDLVANKTASVLTKDLLVCEKQSLPISAFPDCVPENVSKIDFQAGVQQALDRELFSNVPSELAFSFTLPPNIPDNVFEYFDSLIVKVLTVGFFVLVFLLSLMCLFVFSPWNAVAKKIFKALFFASLNVFLLLIIFLVVPAEYFAGYGFDPYLRIYSFFVSALTSNMFYYLFPLILFAFLGWMGIIFYERKVIKA